MDVVVIQMRALAAFPLYDRRALTILKRVESPAGFNTLQNAHQSLLHALLGGNLASRFLFVGIARIQIAVALQFFRLGDQRRFQDLFCYPSDVGFEVLTGNTVDPKKSVHAFGAIKVPKLSLEDQPIETLQNTGDERSKTL